MTVTDAQRLLTGEKLDLADQSLIISKISSPTAPPSRPPRPSIPKPPHSDSSQPPAAVEVHEQASGPTPPGKEDVSIGVSGIPLRTHKQLVEMFFEKHGGKIRSMMYNEEDGSAQITFEKNEGTISFRIFHEIFSNDTDSGTINIRMG